MMCRRDQTGLRRILHAIDVEDTTEMQDANLAVYFGIVEGHLRQILVKFINAQGSKPFPNQPAVSPIAGRRSGPGKEGTAPPLQMNFIQYAVLTYAVPVGAGGRVGSMSGAQRKRSVDLTIADMRRVGANGSTGQVRSGVRLHFPCALCHVTSLAEIGGRCTCCGSLRSHWEFELKCATCKKLPFDCHRFLPLTGSALTPPLLPGVQNRIPSVFDREMSSDNMGAPTRLPWDGASGGEWLSDTLPKDKTSASAPVMDRFPVSASEPVKDKAATLQVARSASTSQHPITKAQSADVSLPPAKGASRPIKSQTAPAGEEKDPSPRSTADEKLPRIDSR